MDVCDDKGEAWFYLETRDGYFNNEMFIKQVDSALDMFERKYPQVTGIFLFDNTRKYPLNSLNVANMNVYPGDWPDTAYGTTCWNSQRMKCVLQERGVDAKCMNAEKMRLKLNEFTDFAASTLFLRSQFIVEDISACICQNTFVNWIWQKGIGAMQRKSHINMLMEPLLNWKK